MIRHYITKDYVFQSDRGCYKKASSPKKLIAVSLGTVCKTALITGLGQGTSFWHNELPVLPGCSHCTWEYSRTPVKSAQPEETAALWQSTTYLEAMTPLMFIFTAQLFDCSLIGTAHQRSIKRLNVQTGALSLFYSFSIPLCQSDPTPRGTKNSIVGVTQQGKAAALDSG